MIKGIYTSGAGMQPRMMRLEVIGNNLANINTTGYKKDNIFVQILKQTSIDQAKGKGELSGLEVQEYTDHSEGSLLQTNNPLDFAIQGSGYFTVETPQGTRYTRSGSFMLSADGILVTQQGYPVLSTTGRIQMPDLRRVSQGDVSVSVEGEIFVDKLPIGRFRIADFDDYSSLKKDGSSMFLTDQKEKLNEADGTASIVRQGFIEESNVEGILEMIAMVELSRSFESDQKSIQCQDATMEKAMELGRL